MHHELTKNFFVNDGYSNQTNFQCPNCRDDYLHQERVEIFDGGEHRANNIRVVVDNGEVTIDTNMADNPSKYRQGLRIFFRCEACETVSAVTFEQHKGFTLVNAITHEFLNEEKQINAAQ